MRRNNLELQQQQAATAANQTSTLKTDVPIVEQGLASGNYLDAWKTAIASESAYGGNQNVGAAATDPLIQALESSKGVSLLDPNQTWTPDQIKSYYDAFATATGTYQHGVGGTGFNGNLVGKNPYGIWGTAADSTAGVDQQAAVNAQLNPGKAPDVQNYLGAHQDENFIEKYGVEAAALALAIAAPYAAPEIGAAIAGSGAVDALATTVGIEEAGAIAGASIYGAGAGALTGVLSGGNVGKDALLGGLGGFITGGISQSGIPGALSDTLGPTAGKIATGLGTSELTSLAKSAITSPSGQSSGGGSAPLSPGVKPVSTPPAAMSNIMPVDTATPPAASSGSSLLGSIGSGIASSLGGSSLGGTLGQIAPYAAVGALGTAQAKQGLASDKAYSDRLQQLGQPMVDQSNKMLSNYNNSTLNPQDQALLTNAQNLATQITSNSAGLSDIAKTAFSNYSSGKLTPGDQAALDQQIADQKQQVAQQLASAGITDSTILAGQYAQIDNQALILKQNLLNAQFATGVTAYDNYLTGTQAGQNMLAQATTTADVTLQGELNSAISSFGAGAQVITDGIKTAMQTDANYSAQISQLYGTLAAAYAKSYLSGDKATNPAAAAAGKAGGAIAKAIGGGGGGGSLAAQDAAGNAGLNANSVTGGIAGGSAAGTLDASQLTSDMSNLPIDYSQISGDLSAGGLTDFSSITPDLSSMNLGGP
jgi:hypothetical protein